MAAKVATSATTSTAPTMSVADSWRRNRPITSTTSTMVSTRVTSTSCSEARMVRVRSLSTSTSTLAGRLARSSGSAASTASVVRTMLAPGCRLMIRPTPGCPFGHACT
ncbi:hypothetical protein G6F22_009977 [Rhizopus arrhizus]|nr:hypothetical protein G6F22_009977 [Rhizopus arrhizus]